MSRWVSLRDWARMFASDCQTQAEPKNRRFFGQSRADSPREGCDAAHEARCDAQSAQNRARGKSSGEVLDESLEAKDAQHPAKVVTECHQTPLAAHLVEASDQEVAVAGSAFQRAEGMFDQAGALTHPRAGMLHPHPMTVDDVFMFPAIHGARVSCGAEAARS